MMKLVMVRHGQSLWNLENRFTGWTDIDLSENGIREAHEAGQLLKANGYTFDLAFTSVLVRANRTLNIILEELGETDIPIKYSWRLNERHYGALQGLNKDDTRAKYGAEQVRIWRRSADVRPPSLEKDDPRYPGNDAKYKDLTPEQLPLTEHLLDTVDRAVEYWNSDIKPALLEGKKCIIAAHGNSIRALVKYLENIGTAEIMNVEIPTGKPLVYELDDKTLAFVKKYYL
ncbi:MAG: 2,3-diphosphoglycerate-dependent phosphoglycerate mutase [bacterium]|nr:2,3-diphosphoglycerate-dependent phosphoglycerate mutase [bacterium]